MKKLSKPEVWEIETRCNIISYNPMGSCMWKGLALVISSEYPLAHIIFDHEGSLTSRHQSYTAGIIIDAWLHHCIIIPEGINTLQKVLTNFKVTSVA